MICPWHVLSDCYRSVLEEEMICGQVQTGYETGRSLPFQTSYSSTNTFFIFVVPSSALVEPSVRLSLHLIETGDGPPPFQSYFETLENLPGQ